METTNETPNDREPIKKLLATIETNLKKAASNSPTEAKLTLFYIAISRLTEIVKHQQNEIEILRQRFNVVIDTNPAPAILKDQQNQIEALEAKVAQFSYLAGHKAGTEIIDQLKASEENPESTKE